MKRVTGKPVPSAHSMAQRKKVNLCFYIQSFNYNVIIKFDFLFLVERGSLERMSQRLSQVRLAPHRDQLESKYYGIVLEG